MRIIGREAELSAVSHFLDGMAAGARALLFAGEAGIGKSTVWKAALAEARGRGYRVAVTRPTEAEARLPFAGLNDLFGELFDELSPNLAEPQRIGLGIALLREQNDGAGIDPLAVSLGAMGLVREAVESGPLLLAIDDIQWLDGSTIAVLEFLLRRLADEPIRLLVAQRSMSGVEAPPPVYGVFAMDRADRLRLGPLTIDEIDRLVRDQLGVDLARSILVRLHRTSGGNPFFAVEIARAITSAGAAELRGELSVPDSLAPLVRTRFDALPGDAIEVAFFASAMSNPAKALLTAALGADVVESGLRELASAGIAQLDGDSVVFSHPLLAAEAFGRRTEERRRIAHLQLAEIMPEPEARAKHLALAAVGPDAEAASALESAAAMSRQRGAVDAAAEMVEAAIGLTEAADGEAIRRRTVLAAEYHMLAGDLPRARLLLEDLLDHVPRGPGRAQVLTRLAEVRLLIDDWVEAERLYRAALRHAGDDVRQRIAIKLGLGGIGNVTGRSWPSAARHVADAMRLADELGDPTVLAATIGHFATWEQNNGSGPRLDLVERAAELEPWTVGLRTMEHPDFDIVGIRWQDGDRAGARELLGRLVARAERTGDVGSLGYLFVNLAALDFDSGDAAASRRRIEQAERIARTTGQRSTLAAVLHSRTILLARTGLVADARECGAEAIRLMTQTGWKEGDAPMVAELATMELSIEDPTASLRWVSDFTERTDPRLFGGDAWFPVIPVQAEALVMLGRASEAVAGMDRFERRVNARPYGRSIDAAEGMRCRGLLLASAGELDTATATLATTAASFAAVGDAWGEARTLMIAGEVHRRARRRAAAGAALERSAELFEWLSAEVWAGRARQELERVTGKRAPGAGGLTPTQRSIAQLVVRGRSNREVADALFMSIHTVESHLTAVYRALGVGSRTELARRFRDSDGEFHDPGTPVRAET